MGDWLTTFAQTYISALPTTAQQNFIDEVIGLQRSTLCDSNSHWEANYVRLWFSAIKPTTAA
ncbi:MAG: hypothetical protein DWB48_11265 [Nitrosomonas sp.]|nr:hypothetical protein [Nitrosomonas sp.]MDF0677577.1 hypothetical protein [Nitrosomonas sp.]